MEFTGSTSFCSCPSSPAPLSTDNHCIQFTKHLLCARCLPHHHVQGSTAPTVPMGERSPRCLGLRSHSGQLAQPGCGVRCSWSPVRDLGPGGLTHGREPRRQVLVSSHEASCLAGLLASEELQDIPTHESDSLPVPDPGQQSQKLGSFSMQVNLPIIYVAFPLSEPK